MESAKVPSQLAKAQISPSSRGEKVLHVTHEVLTVLETLAEGSGVPFLGPAAQIALGILGIFENANHNVSMCKELVEDACNLIFCIYCECKAIEQTSDKIPPRLEMHTETLIGTLEEINAACIEITSRTLLDSLWESGSDKDRISNLHKQLKWALKLFEVQSLINISDLSQRCADELTKHDQPPKTALASVTNLPVKADTKYTVTGKDVAALINNNGGIMAGAPTAINQLSISSQSENTK